MTPITGMTPADAAECIINAPPGQNIEYGRSRTGRPHRWGQAMQTLHDAGIVTLVQKPTGPKALYSRDFAYMFQTLRYKPSDAATRAALIRRVMCKPEKLEGLFKKGSGDE